MSRGLGKVQKAILENLKWRGKMPLSELVHNLWTGADIDCEELETAYASVSRACSKLEKSGYIRKKKGRPSADKLNKRLIEAGLIDESRDISPRKVKMIELVKRKKRKSI